MNPQPEKDLQRRLQQLEASIKSPTNVESSKQTIDTQSGSPVRTTERFLLWFNNQSGIAKVAVLGVAVVFGFAIVQATLKLVASVISLAVLAALVYFGYKFLVSKSFDNK